MPLHDAPATPYVGHSHKIDGDCPEPSCPIVPTVGRDPRIVDCLDKLEALGDVDHVALYLAEQGITGWTTSPTMCAISNYITVNVTLDNPLSQVGVGSLAAHVWTHQGTVTEDVHYPLGPVTAEFVERFDNHEFPALERPEREHPHWTPAS